MGTSCLKIPCAGDESAIVTVDPTVVYLLSCDLISLGALSKSFSSISKGSFTYAMKFKGSNTWTNLKYKLNNPLQSAGFLLVLNFSNCRIANFRCLTRFSNAVAMKLQ